MSILRKSVVILHTSRNFALFSIVDTKKQMQERTVRTRCGIDYSINYKEMNKSGDRHSKEELKGTGKSDTANNKNKTSNVKVTKNPSLFLDDSMVEDDVVYLNNTLDDILSGDFQDLTDSDVSDTELDELEKQARKSKDGWKSKLIFTSDIGKGFIY